MSGQISRRIGRLFPMHIGSIGWIGLCAAALIPACDTLSAPGQGANGPYAPGVDRREAAVSGLEVGHRLMSAGEYELALDAFTRAYLEEGPSAEVFSSLGSANLSLGRLGQAEELLRRAIEIDPKWPEALNNLGLVLLQKGNPAGAEQYLRRAYALDNGESDAIRDNLRRALEMLEKSDHTGGNSPAYDLVQYGGGVYRIQSAADSGANEAQKTEQQP